MPNNNLENFLEVLKSRRSIYNLGRNMPISQEEVVQLVETVVKNAPSAFNSRSARIVLLLNDNQDIFWDLVLNELIKNMTSDKVSDTTNKINGFKAAYGTVLFFEDQNVVKKFQDDFPTYADNFPVWSEHTSAIHQYGLWTSFASANIGASLQHYNPIIDSTIIKEFGLPSHWKLRAQMPFGSIEAAAGEKEVVDLNRSLTILK